MRLRTQEQLTKLFKYGMRRWMAARHRANFCAARGDLALDFVRAERAGDRWFAAVEKVQRQYRCTVH